jgi:hypothetical protein
MNNNYDENSNNNFSEGYVNPFNNNNNPKNIDDLFSTPGFQQDVYSNNNKLNISDTVITG